MKLLIPVGLLYNRLRRNVNCLTSEQSNLWDNKKEFFLASIEELADEIFETLDEEDDDDDLDEIYFVDEYVA